MSDLKEVIMKWSGNNMLYEYLLENYKPNEPIFTADIELGMSGNTLRPMFKQLCDQGMLNSIELKQFEYQKDADEKFGRIFEYMTNHEVSNQKIFFDGQIFDAFSLFTEIIRHDKTDIVLIDG